MRRFMIISAVLASGVFGQDGETKKEQKPIQISGRVQVQHYWDREIGSSAPVTKEGMRIRRGRVRFLAQPSEFTRADVQLEVRDNSPRVLDAEVDLLFGSWTLRAGQFKIPVWREELRSSGKLMLVERSLAAEFLVVNLLSAQHIGVELNGKVSSAQLAVNLSNGSGSGGREDAGRSKTVAGTPYINNGKMLSGRLNLPIRKEFEIGFSAALNRLGNRIDTNDTRGSAWMSGLDGVVAIPIRDAKLLAEGGMYVGSFDRKIVGTTKDRLFHAGDATLLWQNKLTRHDAWAGLDAYEYGVGITYLEPNSRVDDDETWQVRTGPAFLFGSKTRLQTNAEFTRSTAKGSKWGFGLRTQLTVNF